MDLKYIAKDVMLTIERGRAQGKNSMTVLQEIVNNRYKTGLPHIVLPPEATGILINSGIIIPICEEMYSIQEILNGYDFSDLQKNDVFLDLGANFGAVSLLVSSKVSEVHAFEPVYINELKKNTAGIANIKTYQYALSLNETETIEYRGKSKTVVGLTLTEILKKCGGITFIKMDVEGAEWGIKECELAGIRGLEIEVHLFNGEKLRKFTSMLKSAGFSVIVEMEQGRTVVVHARRVV